jgi:hypothetical protein
LSGELKVIRCGIEGQQRLKKGGISVKKRRDVSAKGDDKEQKEFNGIQRKWENDRQILSGDHFNGMVEICS